MKKTVVILLLLLLSFKKGEGQVLYQKRYELGTISTGINSIVQRSNDTYFTIGTFTNVGPVGYAHLMCLDTTGNILWEKAYQSPSTFIVKNLDGTFTIAGEFGTGTSGYTDFAFLKIDSLGNPIRQSVFGFPFYDSVKNIIATSDSGNLLMGYFNFDPGSGLGPLKGAVVKIDGSGHIQRSKKYGASTIISDAIELPGEGYLLYGSTTDFNDPVDYYYSDIILIKTDLLGNVINTNIILTPDLDFPCRFFRKENGNFLFSLATGIFNPFGTEKVLMETDSSLHQIWAKRFLNAGGGIQFFTNIKRTLDNGIIFFSNSRFYKLDGMGNLQWHKMGFSPNLVDYYMNDWVQTEDSSFISVGEADFGMNQGYSVKFGANGEFGCNEYSNGSFSVDTLSLTFHPISFIDSTIVFSEIIGTGDSLTIATVYSDCYTAVAIQELTTPEENSVLVFPAVFSDYINVDFKKFFPSQPVLINIFNSIGAKVQSYNFSPAHHELVLKTTWLKQGIYFLNVQTGNYATSKKIIKL